MIIDVVKTFAPAIVSFVLGLIITPYVSKFLTAHMFWKKKSVIVTTDGRAASITQSLHGDEERRTPRMGGMVVWASALITIILFWFGAQINEGLFDKLNFFSRNQTWLPVFTLIVGALVGLLDDYWSVSEIYDQKAGGLSFKKRLIMVTTVAIIGAWWFYSKLEVTAIIVPFFGVLNIGWLFIPFFIIVMLGTYSGGVIDGLDGLSGGVFAIIFSAYGIIAYLGNQIDLAAFCFVLVGALLAFLWHNIPPARFFMSETGIMALTMTLAVVAFLTQQVLILPIIASTLVISSASSSIQLLSKKFRDGQKVFLVAPVHHHFQAKGWPASTVVMRYWIIGVISAIVGIVIVLLG
ncbi:MAG: phospho-N-acetylmuramoyl-pentapeptide-transferase [Patescibacteria group bacterium]